MYKNKKWRAIFYIYISLLILFVVVKFDGSICSIVARINTINMSRSEGLWNCNLILFRSISHYLHHIARPHGYLNFLGNIIPFIPIGFLIPINYYKLRGFIKTLLMSLIFIIVIEAIQFVTMLGYFDIDDIVLNLLGSLIGYFIYKAKSKKKKRIRKLVKTYVLR